MSEEVKSNNTVAPQMQAPASEASTALIVSSSPHFHAKATVESIMRWVVIALLPACLAAIYFFGLEALRVLVICSLACIGLEYLSAKIMRKKSEVHDGSALVTGLLLAMNLPSSTPWWICLIGSFMAVVVGKMIYGGLGCNPFNPALIGRVALLLAFPVIMTTWPMPRVPGCLQEKIPPQEILPADNTTHKAASPSLMPATTATPLQISKASRIHGNAQTILSESKPINQKTPLTYWQLFLGIGKGGSLGETCGLALLAGVILLICLNIVRWHIPVFYLGTVILITGIAWLCAPARYANPLFHLLTGGLLLGAFFMATDMVTTPVSRTGAIVFGVGCGILTACIRLWGSYPEGVSFSILIMNAFTPLIDRYTAGRPFGMPKQKGIRMPA